MGPILVKKIESKCLLFTWFKSDPRVDEFTTVVLTNSSWSHVGHCTCISQDPTWPDQIVARVMKHFK